MKFGIITSVLVLLSSIVLLSGCGNARPGIEVVIAESIEATNQTRSYRVEMLSSSIEQAETRQTSLVMEFVAPDRLHLMTHMSGKMESSEEQIQIGTKMYTRENSTDDWHVRDWGDERMAARNLAVGVVLALNELVDVKELDDEEVDGIDCYHYTGSMNMEGQQEEELALLDESEPYYEQIKQSYESIEFTRDDMEVWISRDDFLLRQYTVYVETRMYKDKEEDTEEVESNGSTTTLRFYDYNEPIEISAPPTEPVEGVRLSASMKNMNPGSGDPEHQAMEYEITVVNMGSEPAHNLRIFLETEISDKGRQVFEAEPDAAPVTLGRVDETTYRVGWEFNLVELTKQRFLELIRRNTVRATWTNDDGVEHEEVLIQGEE